MTPDFWTLSDFEVLTVRRKVYDVSAMAGGSMEI